jgi:Zn-dependent protease with chaperone function
MKAFENNWLAKLLLLEGYNAIMFFGVILAVGTVSERTRRHETVHAWQYIETSIASLVLLGIVSGFAEIWWPLLFVPFAWYILYGLEAAVSFVHHFFAHKKKDAKAAADEAYYYSMFEEEAHLADNNANYRRVPFEWLRYFGKI